MSAQPTSYVDDQQPGILRQMIFNPPSVALSQQEESQHNTSGLSSLFGAILIVLQYQQMDTPQPFSPSEPFSPVPFSTHQETVKTSQPVQPTELESAQISGLAHTSCTKLGPYKGHPNLPKTINKLHVYAQKTKKHTVQHLHFPTVNKKNCVNECVNVKQILINFHHKTKKNKSKLP